MLSNQKKVEMAPVLNFNAIPSTFTETHQTSSFYEESMQQFQETSQTLMEVDNTHWLSQKSLNRGSTFSGQALGVQSQMMLYEDIALSDMFLNDYYTQVLR